MRATGTQRAQATHDWATIDRFEIATGPAAGTNYRIVNRHSGLVADLSGWSTNDGAPIVQWAAGTGANQRWQPVPA